VRRKTPRRRPDEPPRVPACPAALSRPVTVTIQFTRSTTTGAHSGCSRRAAAALLNAPTACSDVLAARSSSASRASRSLSFLASCSDAAMTDSRLRPAVWHHQQHQGQQWHPQQTSASQAATTHDTNDAKRRLHHEYTSHNSDSSLQCDSYLSLHLLLVRFKQQRHKHTQAALKAAGKDTDSTVHRDVPRPGLLLPWLTPFRLLASENSHTHTTDDGERHSRQCSR
jgi:hypothetical protein